jgi:hypothetical protein
MDVLYLDSFVYLAIVFVGGLSEYTLFENTKGN